MYVCICINNIYNTRPSALAFYIPSAQHMEQEVDSTIVNAEHTEAHLELQRDQLVIAARGFEGLSPVKVDLSRYVRPLCC